jgi:hypothetical protein
MDYDTAFSKIDKGGQGYKNGYLTVKYQFVNCSGGAVAPAADPAVIVPPTPGVVPSERHKSKQGQSQIFHIQLKGSSKTC